MDAALPQRSAARRVLAMADSVDRVIGAVCRAIILVTVIVLLVVLGSAIAKWFSVLSGTQQPVTNEG